ncbi:carcinoembryonic antigen-related cell adhesion molecule 21-like [Sturnira hondurensis]|uniref:carcinoembryonic antigen-related cell adhesion molecule 21-like n=1 Tax=Sturnira hondurensis TaxID=192404 RepID=UPI00187A2CDD|nr:carcinoembryonic antigen-related cell adhesion molecule 21-like [Sturnira hondurensis]
MGFLSVSTHKGLVYRQGLLLVVSLLNFWSQPTVARLIVESNDAMEQMNVVLRVRNPPRNVKAFLWYRGSEVDSYNNIAYLSIVQGNYIRGPPGAQAIVNGDGSLVLKNVSKEDTGVYTLVIQLQGCQKIIACATLDVYSRVRAPTLLASKTIVTENNDSVVMSCDTNHDDIQWFFNYSSLQYKERIKLSYDHRNLTIDPVLRWDAGDYQCKASNPRNSAKSAPLKLDVKFQ